MSCPHPARLVVATRSLRAAVPASSTPTSQSPAPGRRVLSVPTAPSRRRPRAVVPSSARSHRAIVVAPSSPRLSSILTPILTSMSSPDVVRPRLYTLTSLRYPHPVACNSRREWRHLAGEQISGARVAAACIFLHVSLHECHLLLHISAQASVSAATCLYMNDL